MSTSSIFTGAVALIASIGIFVMWAMAWHSELRRSRLQAAYDEMCHAKLEERLRADLAFARLEQAQADIDRKRSVLMRIDKRWGHDREVHQWIREVLP